MKTLLFLSLAVLLGCSRNESAPSKNWEEAVESKPQVWDAIEGLEGAIKDRTRLGARMHQMLVTVVAAHARCLR
jgi:hypothetical protein